MTDIKSALVTGANKGIGLAICQGLLAKNFEVILTARSRKKGKAAVEKLKTKDNLIHFVELDVTNDESIKYAVKRVSQIINSLDIAINNAGIKLDAEVDVLNVSRKSLSQTMNVNAFESVII